MALVSNLLRAEDRDCGTKFVSLIQIIWNTKEFPEDWRIAIICPIRKKGSKLICNKYGGISPLNVTIRLSPQFSPSTLKPLLQTYLVNTSVVPQKGRSAADHIFTIGEALDKCYERNIKISTSPT
jgi:hypothetical protein